MDVAAMFLRFLELDQHLRGCNQQQLPNSTACWKTIAIAGNMLLLMAFTT